MHADIERLIALQQIDSAINEAERRLASEAARLAALDGRLDAARQAVARGKERLAANQAARRDIEKDLAVQQGRLAKYREQSDKVKTNQEYHAIQHEMSFAQNEIRGHEDRMLERMMEADEIGTAQKAADTALADAQKEVEAEKKTIAADHKDLETRVAGLKAERAALVSGLAKEALSVFELVSKRRNGVGVAEAKDGICTVCHVRLRPQIFNNVRRNEAIIQCDSCQRILYFLAAPVPAADAQG
jgi:predicted  nucleic acid-binding Zn-ribbon protein